MFVTGEKAATMKRFEYSPLSKEFFNNDKKEKPMKIKRRRTIKNWPINSIL